MNLTRKKKIKLLLIATALLMLGLSIRLLWGDIFKEKIIRSNEKAAVASLGGITSVITMHYSDSGACPESYQKLEDYYNKYIREPKKSYAWLHELRTRPLGWVRDLIKHVWCRPELLPAGGIKDGYYFGMIPTGGKEGFLLGAIPVRDDKTGRKEFVVYNGHLFEADLTSTKHNSGTAWAPGEGGVPVQFEDFLIYGIYDPHTIYGSFNSRHMMLANWTQTAPPYPAWDNGEGPYSVNEIADNYRKLGDAGIGKLIDIIKDYNHPFFAWTKRSQAARVIAVMDIRDPAPVVEDLKLCLEFEREDRSYYRKAVAASIAYALARITGHHEEYIQVLVSLLGNSDAADRLGDLGPIAKSAVPALIKCLDEKLNGDYQCNKDDIRECAEALGRIGADAETAVPSLVKALSIQPDDYSLRITMLALGRIRSNPELVIPLLEAKLFDSNRNIRWYAAEALFLFGSDSESAIPALAGCLQDEQVRPMASIALRRIKSEQKSKMDLK